MFLVRTATERRGYSCLAVIALGNYLPRVPDTSAPPAAINYKIGNERLIKVTESASRKLNSLLEKQGRASGALREHVVPPRSCGTSRSGGRRFN